MDTPRLGSDWCPTCEPERDPTREILETKYCYQHGLTFDGADDARSQNQGYLSGIGDADPAACRAVQAQIR